MSKFSLDKKGYNTQEVDDYIHNLSLKYEEKLSEQKDRVFAMKNELDKVNSKLQEYVEKDKQISKALVYAVEKADEIESNSQKIYELEIKRVRLLYKRWEELLLEVESKYPQVNSNKSIKILIETFKQSIDEVLAQNFKLENKNTSKKQVKAGLKQKGGNYIQNILNKMDYAFNLEENNGKKVIVEELVEIKTAKKQQQEVDFVNSAEKDRIKSITKKMNNITKVTDLVKGEPMTANFLESNLDNVFANSAYAKNIARKKTTKEDVSPFEYAYPTPNESGFDLKEALNPKQDLDEIMEAFDFFKND